MAKVNFLYRSNKPEAKLILRLLFRHEGTDYVFAGNTKISVTKEYWGKYHLSTRISDIKISNFKTEVNTKINEISNHILNEFENCNPTEIDKKWLTTQIDNFYNPKKNEVIPSDLVSFFDYYILFRMNGTGMSKALLNKNNTIRDKLKEMQSFRNKTIYIKDVNELFMNEFITYYKKVGDYRHNTYQREWGFIKTVCRKARYLGLEVSHQLDDLNIKPEAVDDIQFSYEELERVKNTIYVDEIYKAKKYEAKNLEIAKDWFIISAHSGQRISDFMKFTTEVISTKKTSNGEKDFLDFTQKKTGKTMVIPVLTDVSEILNKRNGNFPPKMLDQKYNEYLKVVCKQAGIDEVIFGGLMIDGRKVDGYYQKYLLATSKNCGRRTFATNYIKELSPTELQNFTGHTTEKMLLTYINKENDEIAIRISEKLDKK
jgi:integrase